MKKSAGLKIGIDIDNVISDSYPAYIDRFNEVYQTNIRYEEIVDFYYLEKYWKENGRRKSFSIELLLHDEEFQLTLPPFNQAREIIRKWHKKGFLIHYITARPPFTEKVTKKWLRMHGFFAGATVDFCDYRSDAKFKKEVADKLDIDILIEDSKEIAETVKIPVLLLDRPWNQGNLPGNVFRVKSWEEIDQFISLFRPK